MALYPVLFADYARYFFPELTGWQHWLLALAVIYSSLALNLLGARWVGRSSVLALAVVTLPFLLFTVLGALKAQNVPWHPWTPGNQGWHQSMGLGLAVVMWNYLGWDNVSTFAGEVEKPKRHYPLAMMISVPLVTLLYLLPIGVGLATAQNWREWQNGDIVRVAGHVVGPWLGTMMSLAIMFSLWSLFNSQLLYASRLPLAMAEDGLLPRWITRQQRRWGTPYVSLLVCTFIYSLFTLLDFRKLVVIDVLIYSIALLLEYAALIKMRRKKPNLPRPFKIPGGWPGLILVTCVVAAFTFVCLVFTLIGQKESWKQAATAAGMLLTGPLAYWIGTKIRKVSAKRVDPAEWLHSLTDPGDRM